MKKITFQKEPIDIGSAMNEAGSDSDGAVVSFIGRARNSSRGKPVLYLEYEAYGEMARKQLQKVVDDAAARWALGSCILIHRIGRVNVGEASIIIAASSPHRQEAFQARHGVKLGIMSFFVKATVAALKAFPRLNAEVQGEEMLLKHYYDIGIAVGASEGLVVPVLRDADRLSFAQIEETVKALAQKAEAGSLSLEDLRGGTFTITNGGVFGSLLSTPILNPPQVGILGLHKIEDRPIVRQGSVIVRPMMYAALSYDHRIVDGREAVQFLVQVKELIEDPENLLLEA